MSTRGSAPKTGNGPRETASGLAGGEAPGTNGAPTGHQDIHDASRQQDDAGVRASNTRHKKVTADKWNQ